MGGDRRSRSEVEVFVIFQQTAIFVHDGVTVKLLSACELYQAVG
jgi:hypothetical protein